LNIQVIRLVTGEEIMGDVGSFALDVSARTVKVKNCVRIMMVPSKDDPNSPGIGLAPFSHWSKEKEIHIMLTAVVSIYEPVTEFKNQYSAVFGGIVVPDNKLILPGE